MGFSGGFRIISSQPLKLEVSGKDFKPLVPVRIMPEDTLFLIAAARDLIPSPWIFYAQRYGRKPAMQNMTYLVNSSGDPLDAHRV